MRPPAHGRTMSPEEPAEGSPGQRHDHVAEGTAGRIAGPCRSGNPDADARRGTDHVSAGTGEGKGGADGGLDHVSEGTSGTGAPLGSRTIRSGGTRRECLRRASTMSLEEPGKQRHRSRGQSDMSSGHSSATDRAHTLHPCPCGNRREAAREPCRWRNRAGARRKSATMSPEELPQAHGTGKELSQGPQHPFRIPRFYKQFIRTGAVQQTLQEFPLIRQSAQTYTLRVPTATR